MIRRGLLSILTLTLGLIPLAGADETTTPSKGNRPPGADGSEKAYLRIYGEDGTFKRLVAANVLLEDLFERLQVIKTTLLTYDVHEEQLKSLMVRCDDIQSRLDKHEREIAVVLFLLDQARGDGMANTLSGREKQLNMWHFHRIIEPLKSVFESSDQEKANYAGCRDGINDLKETLGGPQKMAVRTANAIKANNEASARLERLGDRLGEVVYQMRMRVEGHRDTSLTELLTLIVQEMERQRAILRVMQFWSGKKMRPRIFDDP